MTPIAQLDAMPEPIRLVVWDLDDTFWRGTLSEGGIAWQPEHEAIVIELARRGIVSSICSKNDRAAVDRVLAGTALPDLIIFPSIDWTDKGPRLAALLAAVHLRAQSVLFIDDNPMMRREAAHFVPGIAVADETVIPHLLDHPRLRGAPDPELTRLARYRLLERRHADRGDVIGDTSDFLRASGIVVTIDHDVEAHIDRAVDLVNRTNQLNFTKRRLPEDRDAAREELRALIRRYDVQSGLVHVRDRYGDYGYVGLYVERQTIDPGSGLIHFCFSCRTLGMMIESWLYQRLGRPPIVIAGEVASDILGDGVGIDWIAESDQIDDRAPDVGDESGRSEMVLRGGCELLALSHYCRPLARSLHGEFATHRDGIHIRLEHSVMTRHAIEPPAPDLLASFRRLGFVPEDFDSRMLGRPADDAIWIMTFWGDPVFPLYRHKASGALIAFTAFPAADPFANLAALSPDDIEPAYREHWIVDALAHLAAEYEPAGITAEHAFRETLGVILGRLPPRGRLLVIGSNEWWIPFGDGTKHRREHQVAVNRWTREALAGDPRACFIAPTDYIRGDDDIDGGYPDHFVRTVYHRIFALIRERLRDIDAACSG